MMSDWVTLGFETSRDGDCTYNLAGQLIPLLGCPHGGEFSLPPVSSSHRAPLSGAQLCLLNDLLIGTGKLLSGPPEALLS